MRPVEASAPEPRTDIPPKYTGVRLRPCRIRAGRPVGIQSVAAKPGVRHFMGSRLDPGGEIGHGIPDDKPNWVEQIRLRPGGVG